MLAHARLKRTLFSLPLMVSAVPSYLETWVCIVAESILIISGFKKPGRWPSLDCPLHWSPHASASLAASFPQCIFHNFGTIIFLKYAFICATLLLMNQHLPCVPSLLPSPTSFQSLFWLASKFEVVVNGG